MTWQEAAAAVAVAAAVVGLTAYLAYLVGRDDWFDDDFTDGGPRWA